MHPEPSWNIATHYGTTMPGRATEPATFATATAGWKKRKLDTFYHDNGSLPEQTAFAPSSVQHHLCSPLHVDYRSDNEMKSNSSFLVADGIMHNRQPCLPKRRRLLQQQYLQHPQPRLYALNTTLDIPSRPDPYSPEISPKTIPPTDPHPAQLAAASVLRPCHICHRRPTTREVLDAYANCELCGERACYICLRECSAMDCRGAGSTLSATIDSRDRHDAMSDDNEDPSKGGGWRQTDWKDSQTGDMGRRRRKVCSWCAVEGLTDGGMEVVHCLDCVRRVA